MAAANDVVRPSPHGAAHASFKGDFCSLQHCFLDHLHSTNTKYQALIDTEVYLTMLNLLVYGALAIIILAAWVSGSLDPYQKRLQEAALALMGETKASYGLKSKIAASSTHYRID